MSRPNFKEWASQQKEQNCSLNCSRKTKCCNSWFKILHTNPFINTSNEKKRSEADQETEIVFGNINMGEKENETMTGETEAGRGRGVRGALESLCCGLSCDSHAGEKL